jgi:hypothetical protein
MLILTLWGNPIARKIIIGAGALLAIFYALRLWSNRVYSEGFKSGKTAGLAEMEAQKTAEWKEKVGAMAADAAKNAADRKSLEAQASSLADSRRGIEAALSRSLKQMNTRKEADNAKMASVPDSDLDAALRSVSANLAAAAKPR